MFFVRAQHDGISYALKGMPGENATDVVIHAEQIANPDVPCESALTYETAELAQATADTLNANIAGYSWQVVAVANPARTPAVEG